MTKEGTRNLCGEIDHHLMILGTLEVDLDISHIFSTCLDLMYIMTISHFLFHYSIMYRYFSSVIRKKHQVY